MFAINGDCQIHCDKCGNVCSDKYFTIKQTLFENGLFPNSYNKNIVDISIDFCPECFKTKGEFDYEV